MAKGKIKKLYGRRKSRRSSGNNKAQRRVSEHASKDIKPQQGKQKTRNGEHV